MTLLLSGTKNLSKNVLTGTFVIALLFGLVSLQRGRLATLQSLDSSEQNLQRQLQATASTLELAQKTPAFGFNNLIADWTYLQFLQYFGDVEARQLTSYSLSPEFFKVIIPHDPFYRTFYLFLSGSTSNFAGEPEQTITLIDQGLEHLSPTVPPDSFYIWQYRAVDQLLYLGDGAAARQSYQTAADWARQSDHPDAAFIAESAQNTADFLANNPLSKKAQAAAWISVFSNAFDDATRRKAIERIQALGGTVSISETGGISIQLPTED